MNNIDNTDRRALCDGAGRAPSRGHICAAAIERLGRGLLVAVSALIVGGPMAWPRLAAEETSSAQGNAAPSVDSNRRAEQDSKDDIAAAQKRIAERYKSLRDKLTHMADLLAPTNPRQAALLREAVSKSNDLGIDERLEKVAALLRDQQLSAGVRSQTELQRDLAKILDLLLSEDRGKRLENEKERVKNYLKWLNGLIKEQKSLEAETGRNDDVKPLADRQGQLADRTAELANKIERCESPREANSPIQRPAKDERRKPDGEQPSDQQTPADKDASPPKAPPSDSPRQGKPNDDDPSQPPSPGAPSPEKTPQKGNPNDPPPNPEADQAQKLLEENRQDGDSADDSSPSNPAHKRIEAAQQRMRDAMRRLRLAEKDDAKSQQQQALKELERAKAELESILRQLREEEQVQTLKLLEARLTAMLKLQNDVWEGTKRVDRKPVDQRDHDDEIETGRLSRREAEILVEADKALALLREEAKAVAFVEALAEIRTEMQQVVDFLGAGKTGVLTQGTEEEIIKSLEEMLTATKKARKDRENKKNQPPGQPGGESEDPPLVDDLSQIKMIRSMQVRINNQTQRYLDAITRSTAADRAELSQGLKHLSESQERVRRITRDIASGRNQ